jgi:hypothetical protein
MLVIKPFGFLKQLSRGSKGKGKEKFPFTKLQIIDATQLRELALEWVACVCIRIFMAFSRNSEQCLFPSPQSALDFINLSRLVVGILKFL